MAPDRHSVTYYLSALMQQTTYASIMTSSMPTILHKIYFICTKWPY